MTDIDVEKRLLGAGVERFNFQVTRHDTTMAVEKTQIKFAISLETGELIGFVSRNPKTQKLMGVREDSIFGKQICLLSEDLKEEIKPNKLYNVHLKPMHNRIGYVVVAAQLIQFPAQVGTFIIPDKIYQVTIGFGNKTLYFDPINGGSPYSRTLSGVIKILRERDDILNVEHTIKDLIHQATNLVEKMVEDGYIVPDYTLQL